MLVDTLADVHQADIKPSTNSPNYDHYILDKLKPSSQVSYHRLPQAEQYAQPRTILSQNRLNSDNIRSIPVRVQLQTVVVERLPEFF